MFESWPEMWGGGYPAYRTTLRKFLWFRTVTGGNAPEFKTVTGKIVSFLTKRIAPLKIEADLEPIQDLHGYDNPWPGGGGKNKFGSELVNGAATASAIETGSEYRVRSNKVAVEPSTSYILSWKTPSDATCNISFYDTEAATSRLSVTTGITNGASFSVPSTAYFLILTFIPLPDTRTISPTEFSEVMIRLSSVSDATFAPYSNICPISGHEGAVVTDTGVNIWGGEKMANDMVAAVNDASGCAKGSDTDGNYVFLNASNAINLVTVFDKFKESTRYTMILKVKKGNTNKSLNLRINYTNGTFENVVLTDTPTADTIYTHVVTTANGKSVQNIQTMWGSGTAYFYYDYCGIFEGVLTADQFEAYSGTSVTLTFGSTVYGGTLTVNEDGTGSVVAEWAEKDMGDMSWTAYEETATYGGLFYSITLNSVIAHGSKDDVYTVCENYKSVPNKNDGPIGSATEMPNSSLRVRAADGRIYVRDDSHISDNGTAFKTAMDGVQLVYQLATPITIPLTPGQVEALLGNNTVWVDESDNISVTYQSN